MLNRRLSLLDEFKGFFHRTGDHRFVTNLDDGAVEQAWIFDDGGDNVVIGGGFGQRQVLELRLFGPQKAERRNTELLKKVIKFLRGQRLDKIIDLVVIDAVFTKQRGQIAAGRSGRFFVNGNFVWHKFNAEARSK